MHKKPWLAARGEKNGRAKLTEEIIIKIREEAGSLRQVGRQYGISKTTVRDIRLRRIWKHVK
jgi:lambda repressor-like predicted transcriptional regulator